MILSYSKQILMAILTIAALSFSSQGSAEESKKEKDFPKSGTLASTTGGGTSVSAGGFGKTAISPDDEPAPIGGSVSKDKNNWVAKVFNNSADPVSGNFKVLQINKAGTVIKSDTFSASLAPGKSMERKFGANPMAVSGSLEVTSWKSHKKPAAPKEGDVPAGELAPLPEGGKEGGANNPQG